MQPGKKKSGPAALELKAGAARGIYAGPAPGQARSGHHFRKASPPTFLAPVDEALYDFSTTVRKLGHDSVGHFVLAGCLMLLSQSWCNRKFRWRRSKIWNKLDIFHNACRNFVHEDASDGDRVADQGRGSKRRRSAERERRKDHGRSSSHREKDIERQHSHRRENDRQAIMTTTLLLDLLEANVKPHGPHAIS